MASSQSLPECPQTISSSHCGDDSVDDSLSALSTILASQDEERQRIRYVLSEEPQPPSPIGSTCIPTEFSQHTASSALSSLESSQFPDSIPDSGSHIAEALSSTFFVPESSPSLLASRAQSALPSHSVSSPLALSDVTELTPIPVVLVRDATTRSFIHFHGNTSGSGSARR